MRILGTHPLFWFSVLALCALALWTIIGKEGGLDAVMDSEPSSPYSGDDAGYGAKSTDRDNAAEEVRAVATRISNIEQVIENQTEINRTERERLRRSMQREIENVVATIEHNSPASSMAQLADSLNDLEMRLSSLEDKRLPPADESATAPFEDAQIHWISSVDSDWFDSTYETLQRDLSPTGGELMDTELLQSESGPRQFPYYTIPATTTLLDATALTALVGRIPIRGQLEDPWRFKVLVGAQNIASNGHRIPRLAGMLLAGTARGDLSLSCVSGNIDTATFIFADGTIQTTRKFSDPANAYTGLGWISDEFGNPCISGELKSNALQYLTQATLVNTAQATAEAIANAQTETATVPGTGETRTSLVGDLDRYVVGYATEESLSTVAEWLNDRQLNSFDAIYVPAGQSVAVHIEETIAIDQDPAARKIHVSYSTANYDFHASQGWID